MAATGMMKRPRPNGGEGARRVWLMEVWVPSGRGRWDDHRYESRPGRGGNVVVEDGYKTRHVKPAGSAKRCTCFEAAHGRTCDHQAIADAHAFLAGEAGGATC
jgi:hypothetical protein